MLWKLHALPRSTTLPPPFRIGGGGGRRTKPTSAVQTMLRCTLVRSAGSSSLIQFSYHSASIMLKNIPNVFGAIGNTSGYEHDATWAQQARGSRLTCYALEQQKLMQETDARPCHCYNVPWSNLRNLLTDYDGFLEVSWQRGHSPLSQSPAGACTFCEFVSV